jgi:hypothetical protein
LVNPDAQTFGLQIGFDTPRDLGIGAAVTQKYIVLPGSELMPAQRWLIYHRIVDKGG